MKNSNATLILEITLIIFSINNCIITATFRAERSLYSGRFHVTPNEARLVVSLTSYFRNIAQYCSGTLLTDRVVLTAAHCLYRNDVGVAENVRVTNEGWTYFATMFTIRRDFIFLPIAESICADMALVILPQRVPGFIGLSGIKFAQFNPEEMLKEGTNAEIFALGYGITEYNRISLLPRKVPMKMIDQDSECTLNFQFSHSAISCSGDSGGPVLFYPKNATVNGLYKMPVYLGLSSQIAIYDEKDEPFLGTSVWERKKRSPSLSDKEMTAKQEIENCKRARELNVLQTYYIQNWLAFIVRTEKNASRKLLYTEALKSIIGF